MVVRDIRNMALRSLRLTIKNYAGMVRNNRREVRLLRMSCRRARCLSTTKLDRNDRVITKWVPRNDPFPIANMQFAADFLQKAQRSPHDLVYHAGLAYNYLRDKPLQFRRDKNRTNWVWFRDFVYQHGTAAQCAMWLGDFGDKLPHHECIGVLEDHNAMWHTV